MNTTRSGSLTASGAATTGDIAHAQDRGHDHGHETVPSDLTLRVKALESLLVEKRRRHETEFKARWVPLLPRESAKKTFNVGDRSLPERHALFPRRSDAWRA
jgi:hypothetical protein